MSKNPYIYLGPLDPIENKDVLISRSNELDRVIEGIKNGDYWAILGPRQIGKTTFLRQIENKLTDAYHIYFDLESPVDTEEDFYQELIDEFLEKISPEAIKTTKTKNFTPKSRFINLLENIKLPEDKKIILQFDEIDGLKFSRDFCHIWRRIYQQRFHKKALNTYSIIVTGASELLYLTSDRKSHFNIAKKLYLKDFSDTECERLINGPFKKLNIQIKPETKEKLIDQLSGHPQLLQHSCYILLDIATRQKRDMDGKAIDNLINLLLETNGTLDTLKQDIKNNDMLKNLVRDILEGKKKKYHPYKEFSITGAGCIVEGEGSFCKLRNKLFEKFLRDILESLEGESEATEEIRSIIKKYEQEDAIEDNSSRKYKIIEMAGKGGIGVVFKAEEMKLGRMVALKMLNSRMVNDKRILKKFYDEARTTASLEHPNIVRVYGVGQIGDDHFISMEFIEGEDLLTKINNFHEFMPSHIFYITKETLKALHYAHTHKNKIIHGDVKPQNIMISHKKEIKIVDFGLAVIKNRYLKKETDAVFGTIHYMAPEQFKGIAIDPRTDIYSIGVTIFHLISGTVPFKGENIPLKHLEDPVPVEKLGKDAPKQLVQIVKKCMEKDRKNRYQSAQELIKEIEKVEMKIIGRVTTKEDIKDIITTDNGTRLVLENNIGER